jgi:hypothetical protein
LAEQTQRLEKAIKHLSRSPNGEGHGAAIHRRADRGVAFFRAALRLGERIDASAGRVI